MFRIVKEQNIITDNCFTKDQVENAIHWVENSIIGKDAFEKRPSIMKIRMFDEYTTSNAESEHASLKKSLGLQRNGTMTALFQKTNQDAHKKHKTKLLNQHQDLERTNVNTKCFISNFLVQSCFRKIQARLTQAKDCISKQVNDKKWIVVYRQSDVMRGN